MSPELDMLYGLWPTGSLLCYEFLRLVFSKKCFCKYESLWEVTEEGGKVYLFEFWLDDFQFCPNFGRAHAH